MKRELRKIGASVLPEFLKSSFRKTFIQGYRNSKVNFDVNFLQEEHGNIRVNVDEEISFSILEEVQPAILYHFLDNADSIEEMSAFISLCNSHKTLFDVGAQYGLFSLIFCSKNRDNLAIAYEPSPILYPKATSIVHLNSLDSQIKLENYAIGKEKGAFNFSLEDEGFIQICPSSSTTKGLEIEVTSIDSECLRLNIHPDILKIDIEGYEFEALLGAENLLKEQKPTIFLELHLHYLESRGIRPKEVLDYLENHQYSFFSCTGQALEAKQIYDSIKSVYRFIGKSK